ncbi:hypothetical protein M271_40745 [Streptomyces rapamycinicus NRRL 5491]|nr:hypothetical protein M271_40745 [Streptomyces rapamycinicus NRRL 5491]
MRSPDAETTDRNHLDEDLLWTLMGMAGSLYEI